MTRAAIAGLVSLALALPAGAQAPDAPAAWTLAPLPDDPVPFHGLVGADNAGSGSPGGMMYPTAGLGVLGLLVGVATHAALVGGTRSAQETRMQKEADTVLAPYSGMLARFHNLDLQRRALALASSTGATGLFDAGQAPAGDAFVQVQPLFAIAPDHAAMLLDETVVVRPSPTSDKGVQQVVRVISSPRLEENPRAAWSADDGAALKATAAALMAESIAVALRQSRQPLDDKAPFLTLRYAFGDAERMERAQLLEENCDRLVMRTLRGTLLVVPHKAGATLPEGCPPAPVPARRVAAPTEASAASAATPAASASSAVG